MLKYSVFYLCISLIFASPSRTIDPRIFNGEEASLGQFPWQAHVWVIGTYVYSCAGAIISPEWIVTAAKCFRDASIGYVYTGQVAYNGGQRTNATELIRHEFFSTTNERQNDIALLKLSTPLSFDAHTKSIALGEDYLEPGTETVFAGWGARALDGTSNPSDFLMYAYVNIVSNEECERVYGEGTIYSDNACAVAGDGDVNSICYGDEGNPLVSNFHTTPKLVGIGVFYNTTLCQAGSPSGFTRIAPYRGWIRKHTGI